MTNRRRALKALAGTAGLAGLGRLGYSYSSQLNELAFGAREQAMDFLSDARHFIEETRFENPEEIGELAPVSSRVTRSLSGRAADVRTADSALQPSDKRIFPEEEAYARFLGSLELRYLQPYEVIRAHRRTRNGVLNSVPPRRLWKKLAPTLKVADEIRHRLGTPLNHVTSAYRSPAYNRQCPGAASRSYHTRNQAVDLIFSSGSKVAFETAKELRAEGFFQGGLGLYRSFLHVDTRGYNATWGQA